MGLKSGKMKGDNKVSKETLMINFDSKKEKLVVRGVISPYNETKLLIDILYATISNQGYSKQMIKELIEKQNNEAFEKE